eukprot:483867-Prymnesium_polylepis.3
MRALWRIAQSPKLRERMRQESVKSLLTEQVVQPVPTDNQAAAKVHRSVIKYSVMLLTASLDEDASDKMIAHGAAADNISYLIACFTLKMNHGALVADVRGCANNPQPNLTPVACLCRACTGSGEEDASLLVDYARALKNLSAIDSLAARFGPQMLPPLLQVLHHAASESS